MPAESDLIADVYQATAAPWLVDVPEMGFLMIDGHGDPNTSSDYQEAVQALYALSYALKSQIKRAGGDDFKVGPLEGLWWGPDMSAFTTGDKSSWDWSMMIRQPDAVTEGLLPGSGRRRYDVRPKSDQPLQRIRRAQSETGIILAFASGDAEGPE